jgi:son of sevenless-like protein
MKVLDNDELPQSDNQPINDKLTQICTKIKAENDRTRKEINEILKNEPNIKIQVRSTDVVDLATLQEREQDDDTIKFIKGPKGEAIVRAANVDRLVERLTSSTYSDVLFRDSFLLTYRSFMTSTELMEKLIDRYCVTPVQKDLSAAILEALRQKQVPIRSRVLSVIKRWIDKYFFDFSNQLFEKMFLNFMNNTVSKTGYEQQVQPLIALYHRKKQGIDDDKQPNNPPPPEPLLPMFIKFNGICDLNPVEVARQITLVEASLFKAIKPHELLNQAWTKKDKETKAPNALKMIRHSSRISYLVVHEILRCESIARRVEAIKRFIDTAHECSKIGNFNAVMELTAGLGNVAISRLQKTWREVENEKVFLLEDLQEYSNNNYKILRTLVHSTPSVIPFLGVYLTDLTFIEDGSKDLFGNLINFSKHLKIAEQILELQRFQQSLNYNFKPIDYIQNFIESSELIDEETAYEMSVKLEAKKLPKVFDT